MTASITAAVYDLICEWLEEPNPENEQALQHELIKHKQTWHKKLTTFVANKDPSGAEDYCASVFGSMFSNMGTVSTKRFRVRYSKFVVIRFVYDSIHKSTNIAYELSNDPPTTRSVTNGPFSTQYYVIQVPITKSEDCKDIMNEIFGSYQYDQNYVKQYCQKNDISPDVIRKVLYTRTLHIVVSLISGGDHYIYIRPVVNEEDKHYKNKNQHIMFCDIRPIDEMATVNFYGDVSELVEYKNLFDMIHRNKVDLLSEDKSDVEVKQEEPKPAEEPKPTVAEPEYVVVQDTEKEKEIAELKRQRDEIIKQLEGR